MSWGHATSPDLVTWTEHPVALPCTASEEIFSGSCVFDVANTSGLGTAANPPLVAIYTSHYRPGSPRFRTQAQSLAFSLDDGFTWTTYPGNPVVDRGSKDFRDPKVFRFEDHWVMVAVEAEDQQVVLYRSDNLLDWSFLSHFGPAHAVGGAWECPDLFELPIDGSDQARWMLVVNINPGAVSGGGGAQYFLGDFDGTTFTPEHLADGEDLRCFDWLDFGRDFYAAVSFADVPDGRRILIGWMSNWDYCREIPLTGGRSAMTLPREIGLRLIDGRPVPWQVVAREVTAALGEPVTVLHDPHFQGRRHLEHTIGHGIVEVHLDTPPQRFEVVIGGVGIAVTDGVLTLDRSRAGRRDFHPEFASRTWVDLPPSGGGLDLVIAVDSCSLEVFAADGAACLTNLVFFDLPEQSVELFSDDEVGLTVSVATR